MTDKQGDCRDEVEIARVPEGSTTEWAITRAPFCLVVGGVGVSDALVFEIGLGCRELGIVFEVSARCSRFSEKVTAHLLGGADSFAIAANSQPIAGGLTVNLGAGDDSATGSPGAEAFNGGSGNDQLRGEAGNDTLAGNDGNDGIRPGTGADAADGGAGDDDIRLSTAARDETGTVHGGLGTDTAQYADDPSGPGGDRLTPLREVIEANLETLAGEKDTAKNDVLRSIERYGGGASSDIITGGAVVEPEPLQRRAVSRPAVRHQRGEHARGQRRQRRARRQRRQRHAQRQAGRGRHGTAGPGDRLRGVEAATRRSST